MDSQEENSPSKEAAEALSGMSLQPEATSINFFGRGAMPPSRTPDGALRVYPDDDDEKEGNMQDFLDDDELAKAEALAQQGDPPSKRSASSRPFIHDRNRRFQHRLPVEEPTHKGVMAKDDLDELIKGLDVDVNKVSFQEVASLKSQVFLQLMFPVAKIAEAKSKLMRANEELKSIVATGNLKTLQKKVLSLQAYERELRNMAKYSAWTLVAEFEKEFESTALSSQWKSIMGASKHEFMNPKGSGRLKTQIKDMLYAEAKFRGLQSKLTAMLTEMGAGKDSDTVSLRDMMEALFVPLPRLIEMMEGLDAKTEDGSDKMFEVAGMVSECWLVLSQYSRALRQAVKLIQQAKTVYSEMCLQLQEHNG